MDLVTYSNPTPTVGLVTLNDPASLNAMGGAMADQFASLIESLRPKKDTLRALILTGAGKAFSAGGDLAMLEGKRRKAGEENRLEMLRFYNSFLRILTLDLPVIAAINGAAIGAGLCVASACDIRLASQSAKLGFTFVRLGLHPGMGATYFLRRVIGPAAAAELMLTGRVISSEEALRIGLVSRVVADGDLLKSALEIASEIEAGGPEAIRQLLASVRGGESTLELALQREALNQSINYASAEFAEGISAVKEKRKAKFTI